MLVFLYDVISCDVINLKHFHEILRYCFSILAMPLSFLSNKESDIDLPRNLIGLSEIGRIEYMLLLTSNDNALPFKIS